MRHEAWESFTNGVRRLLARSYKIPELTDATELTKLDSMGVTELCVLAEEELQADLSYDLARSCKTWGELKAVLEGKGI